MSYEETLKLEASSDVMLAIYDPSIENHIFAAPNKFYEALMLGKPLLMVRNTGLSNNLEKYNIGVLIDYSERSFEMGIETLLSRKKEWQSMSKRMKNVYNQMYNWDIMKKRLTDMYDTLFKEKQVE